MTPEELWAFAHSPAGEQAARSCLGACLHLDAAIAVKLSRLDALRRQAAKIGGCLPGICPELDALEEEVLRDYRELTQRQREIADRIRQVPDERHRAVLELRYLQGMPFFRIAMQLHYDERQIYRFHRHGLHRIAALLAAEEK